MEKGMVSANSIKAYNTLKALTKTPQHMSAAIEYSSGNILTKRTAVLNRWTQYCSGLYNYKLHGDTSYSRVARSPQKSPKAYLC